MSYHDNKYPLEPPYEDEVVFYEGAVLRVSLLLNRITQRVQIERPRYVLYVTIPFIFV